MLLSFFGLITIKTPAQLDALSMQTYILGAIAGIVFLLIAAIIAQTIKFEGGSNPKDPRKRRIWFWILFVATFAAFFSYNMFSVQTTVGPNLQSKFVTTNIISSTIAVVVYFILGFIISKVFSTGKLGNWFHTKR